ncbi:glycerol-3-phosphate o-acyltransferase [Phaffia rhodozyma]|uniref:Glycerol-3-phosphate o-acyltransferase n=1 Tax=Phaffia rhodozyma TaxID=264483 RepID=A0A0F7SPP9_PHARH|nr:glycerol-3-phosphate o-acyltransferase [Phaffia rhodozyma]
MLKWLVASGGSPLFWVSLALLLSIISHHQQLTIFDEDPPFLKEMIGLSVYEIVLAFWRFVVDLFFREIKPRGAYNIPREGPVLFVVAPHNNQFLDPILVFSEIYRETRRKVGTLIAAKSLDRAIIGQAARAMDSIPVARASDYAYAGSGKISLSSTDPLLILGEGTKFITDIKPKSTLALSKSLGSASAEIEEVISDTEVRLKREFSIPAKEGGAGLRATERVRKEGENGPLSYKVLPHVDQHGMYGAVYKRLKEGKAICIFPEGGSHDRTDLLPLKAGVTLMTLGAMAADPTVKVKIVPVGLSYFHAHKFRSRAVIEFGTPMDVPPELVLEFGKGGKEKREACGKLLEMIYDGLKTVTLRAPDWETLMVIQAARRLYKTPGQNLTLGRIVELNKRFVEGYMHYEHEPRVQALRTHIIQYNRLLRDLGLRDHQVERATRAGLRSLGLLAYRVGLLGAWSVLALPGVILHAPIFLTAKYISHQKAKVALAESTVKLAGRDVLATWKVIVSLVLTPITYAFWAALATYLAYRRDAPSRWVWWMPVWVVLGLPFTGMSSLKFGEAAMDVMKSLRPLVINLIPGNDVVIRKTRDMRVALTEELTEVINHFGPLMYEDFDEGRIQPAATVQPVSADRSRSSTAQNIFSHPMSWIDEKLFGWSAASSAEDRAARQRRRSKSQGSSRAESRVESTQGSDVEKETVEQDDGDADYDQVIGILHHHASSFNNTAAPRSSFNAGLESSDQPSQIRARRNGQTYAELQSAKKAAAAAVAASGVETKSKQELKEDA